MIQERILLFCNERRKILSLLLQFDLSLAFNRILAAFTGGLRVDGSSGGCCCCRSCTTARSKALLLRCAGLELTSRPASWPPARALWEKQRWERVGMRAHLLPLARSPSRHAGARSAEFLAVRGGGGAQICWARARSHGNDRGIQICPLSERAREFVRSQCSLVLLLARSTSGQPPPLRDNKPSDR